MVTGIKQGQVIVGKVKHPKVGKLPTNVILFAVEGNVEHLDLKLDWIQEPLVIESKVDLGDREGYVKAIKSHAGTMDKDEGRRLECLVDSLHGASSNYFYDVLDPSHCVVLHLSKNHGVELGDRWK